MKRWFWILLATATAVPTTGWAQTRTVQRPGYLAIRVNVGGTPAPVDPMAPGSVSVPGSPAGFPGSPDNPMATTGTPAPADFSRSVLAVVPVTRLENRLFYPTMRQSRTNPRHPAIYTPYGSTLLYIDNATVQLYPVLGTTLEHMITGRYRKVKTLDALYDLTADAVSAGLNTLAIKYATELVQKSEKAEGDKLSPRITAAVKALKVILPDLTADLPQDPNATLWRDRYRAVGIEESAHYALIHFGDSFVSQEILGNWLDQLEANYNGFYLWHALQGVAIPWPAKKMTVTLVDRSNEFARIREALDGQRIVSDSFYAPLHNLLVLSPERLDDAGRTFTRFVQTLYREGWNRSEMIKGKAPPIDNTNPETINEQMIDITRVMTIALVDRQMQDEAERAAISREAIRQLYASTGILNPYVQYPHWLEDGVGHLFHKPKGPIISDTGNGNSVMTVTLHNGHGAPNYVLHRLYQQMLQQKEIAIQPEVMLRNTLLDRYYDAIRLGVDPDPSSNTPTSRPREISLVRTRPSGPALSGLFTGPRAGFAPGMEGMIEGDPAMTAPMPGSFPGAFPGAAPPFPRPGFGAAPLRNLVAEREALMTRLTAKSQVTSWALMYYLANTKLPQLLAFFAELNRLPRDVPLPPDQVMQIFCQSFGLWDATTKTVEEAAFTKFSNDWVQYMKTVNPTGVDISVNAFTTPNTSGEIGGFSPMPMNP